MDAMASAAEHYFVQPKACPEDSISDPGLGAWTDGKPVPMWAQKFTDEIGQEVLSINQITVVKEFDQQKDLSLNITKTLNLN